MYCQYRTTVIDKITSTNTFINIFTTHVKSTSTHMFTYSLICGSNNPRQHCRMFACKVWWREPRKTKKFEDFCWSVVCLSVSLGLTCAHSKSYIVVVYGWISRRFHHCYPSTQLCLRALSDRNSVRPSVHLSIN